MKKTINWDILAVWGGLLVTALVLWYFAFALVFMMRNPKANQVYTLTHPSQVLRMERVEGFQ